jgi:porin
LVTGFFPNIAYGQEGFLNANSMLTALPWFGSIQGLSLYGGTFVTINKDYQIPESGVVALGTKNVATEWSSLSDSFDDGVFLFGFHRFLWKMDDKLGYFMPIVGGSTKAQASNDPHDFVDIPGQGIESTETHKPWNVGFYLYQDIWQAKDDLSRKANIMIGGTAGPENPQFAQYNIFANVEAFGLMKSRPKDRVGMGGWWNGLSNNFEDLVSPVVDLQDLWGLEVYYNYAINQWAHLSPDLQLLQNAQEDDDVAVVSGVRLTIDF